MNNVGLLSLAKNVTKNSHVPYSNFTVGAALLASDGKIYTGCNIENHGIMSICAERVAFCKAISEGVNKFEKIAIVAKNKGDKVFSSILPCGYCRQFMSEFCDKNFVIITEDEKTKEISEYTLEELLPNSFDFNKN